MTQKVAKKYSAIFLLSLLIKAFKAICQVTRW
jgi:hypothetical protein